MLKKNQLENQTYDNTIKIGESMKMHPYTHY
jgi:hypothetical protein